MPVLPRHPNCKCHYENIYDTYPNEKIPKVLFKAKFHVKGLPQIVGFLCRSQEFSGMKDLLDKLEKRYPSHSIKYLIIINHGDDNAFDLGEGDDLKHIGNRASRNDLKRFKRMLAPDATLEIRMCRTITEKGDATAQHIADIIGCKVIAYRNKVNPVGGKAPYTWSNPDKKIFLPKIEKR